MVKKEKNKGKREKSQNLQHSRDDLLDVEICQDKIYDFRCSIKMNPIRVTRQSIIKYREMCREINLLSRKYPEIWLIYERLPKKIWQFNNKRFNILYYIVAIIILPVLNSWFEFFEFGFGGLSRFGGEIDAVYILYAFAQIPFYFLIKDFFCKRIEKICGLLSDLNDMIKDRMDSNLK